MLYHISSTIQVVPLNPSLRDSTELILQYQRHKAVWKLIPRSNDCGFLASDARANYASLQANTMKVYIAPLMQKDQHSITTSEIVGWWKEMRFVIFKRLDAGWPSQWCRMSGSITWPHQQKWHVQRVLDRASFDLHMDYKSPSDSRNSQKMFNDSTGSCETQLMQYIERSATEKSTYLRATANAIRISASSDDCILQPVVRMWTKRLAHIQVSSKYELLNYGNVTHCIALNSATYVYILQLMCTTTVLNNAGVLSRGKWVFVG